MTSACSTASPLATSRQSRSRSTTGDDAATRRLTWRRPNAATTDGVAVRHPRWRTVSARVVASRERYRAVTAGRGVGGCGAGERLCFGAGRTDAAWALRAAVDCMLVGTYVDM